MERVTSEEARDVLRQGCVYDHLTQRLCQTLLDDRLKIERLRNRLLTAAGDDLCRLSQEEIKAYSQGGVPIPPKEEFLASCERFHAQVAGEAGVNHNCLTLAQLIAENERLTRDVETLKGLLKQQVGDEDAPQR